jgi:membrane-anchored glycerophosphoryl diester phosphodiesterase (GDPDase)
MEPLRPMNLGEILDRTFQIYRSRFLVFVGIAALPAVAMMCLDVAGRIWVQSHQTDARLLIFYMTFARVVTTAVLYHMAAFFQYLARPAFINATVRVIENENASIRGAIASLLNRLREFVVLDLAQLTIILPLPAFLFIGSAIGIREIVHRSLPGTGGYAVAALLALSMTGILAGYVLWIGSCFAFSFQASALEDAPWFAALKRSWRLAKGTRFRLMLTWFLILLVGWGLKLLFEGSAYFFLRALPHGLGNWHGYLPYQLAYSLADATVSILLGPVLPIALTLFYYDQRIRKEGYDIERMMDAAGLIAPAPPPAGDSPIASVAEEESKA